MVRGRTPTAGKSLTVDGLTAVLVRKRVKNVTLRVYPPDGRVEVSAPMRMPERDVVAALVSRRAWIERHRRRVAAVPRPEPPACADGETLCVLGQRRTLRFVTRRAGRRPDAVDTAPPLLVPVAAGADRAARLRALREALRGVAKREFAAEVAAWSPRLGVPTPEVHVRRMTSRWGTCHVDAGKVFLNLALVTRPRRDLEYVVVHELAHLLVPDHSPRFWALVARHLPGWRQARSALHAAPLWADPLWGPSAELDEVEEAR